MSKFKKWYSTNNVEPLFDNINKEDYFEPIKRFYKMHNIMYSNNKLNDEVMSLYIKSQKNMSILVVYPPALKHPLLIERMMNSLKENGTVHYIKDISMNYFMAYNTIYQLYSYEKRMKTNMGIIEKVNRLQFNHEANKNIRIIVYSLHNKDLQLHGKSVEYKMFLRNIFLDFDIMEMAKNNIIYDETNHLHPRSYDYLHVSDNDMMVYDYTGLFFNKNSLRFLKKQKAWRMLEFPNGKNYLNLLKSFILTNYSQMEMEKLLVISSGVLYSYGIRDMNDIDCILLESQRIKDPNELNNIIKIDTGENNEKTLTPDSIDISYQPVLAQEWIDELNNRAVQLGAANYMELVLNPKYYYYFMGFKFLRLKYEIIIRYKRQRPAQFTDLLIIRQMFRLKYVLNIPTETKMYDDKNKTDIIKKVNTKEYIDTIKFYLKTRYYIKLTSTQIMEWIENFKQVGGDTLYTIIENVADDSYVYTSLDKIIQMGYDPHITIYNDMKPYLYPGEDFNIKGCLYKNEDIIRGKKTALRVVSFNVHNFIKRCNTGIAPLYGESLNPFEKPRDISRFINFFSMLDADVLCLQELVPTINKISQDIKDFNYIRDNFNFKYFNEMMISIGYKYYIVGPTQVGHILKNESNSYYYLANGIYSKYKFEESSIYSYNFINRNSIMVKIKWNYKLITIYCNHWEYVDIDDILIKQSNALEEIIKKNDTYNSILCGDFNINMFENKNGIRYNNWDKRTQFYRDNFMSTNKSQIATNFSQLEQTDFIILNKKHNIKNVYSTIVKTDISDHYAILTDFK